MFSAFDPAEGGLRFIDFRTLYSSGKKGKKDWFSLHGCQTNSPSLDYLKQVRQWLDLHPHEMVVFWISRHGDVSLNGTKQYPGTTVAQRRAYWAQIEAVFEGKLVDSTHGALNEVTMAEHWSRGAQVVIYATDYAEFTGSASTAIDAMHVDNQLGGSSIEHIPKGMKDALGVFSPGTRRSDKASNRFYLVSMANSGPQVGEAAEYKYVPFAQKGAIKSCEQIFGIPNMTGWCPLTLMDVGSLGNYYNQQVLEQVYTTMTKDRSNGRATLQFEFPNAIYIDGIGNTATTGAPGTLHTGIAQVCGAGATCTTTLPMPPKSLPHADTAYAYAATVVGSNFLKLCPPSDATATGDGSTAVSAAAAAAAACATNMAQVTQLRQANPLTLWDEPKYGRVTAPPSTWPQH